MSLILATKGVIGNSGEARITKGIISGLRWIEAVIAELAARFKFWKERFNLVESFKLNTELAKLYIQPEHESIELSKEHQRQRLDSLLKIAKRKRSFEKRG